MSFTAPKFTNAGRQLQTRVIAGDVLTFTAIKLGDGTMTTEPIAALTDLIHGIITLSVHEVRRNADYAEVTGVFQNAGLSSGFYWREIGIFAADPDYPNDRSHDILYCYQNAAELAEYIPSASSAVIEKIIRVACVVGDAENVTVGLASQAYAKAEDLQALEEQHSKDVERIDNALDAIDPTKITTKTEPADGDGVMIADSADGGKAKRLSWTAVKTALGKVFVPLARKINGKGLGSDVTLTGDDIAMGADDAETLRAAMAKRVVTAFPAATDLHTIPVGQFYWYDGETANTPYKAGIFGGTQGIAICTAQNASQSWCTLFVIEHAGHGVGIQAKSGGPWKDWIQLALCRAPDTHDLPLASGISAWQPCTYFRNQFREVTISGCASGNLTNETVIATLPEGFRPSYLIETAAAFEASGVRVAGVIIIEASGEVSIRVASRMNYVSFSASFVAA